ncbi:putative transcriptional regulatory protein C3C7.04 [Colletotrichum higginsianum]|uniref:Putative transcriptional regulatory protein C3C7.04 n=1 Tax=Colletotrichum higginsianum TaxID=80884 RepID=A0A4T0WE48_9PEZI|nr:putative transcriptional regulatory protein C3C7.04 [Colletotrichum higginsianum]
MDATNRDTPQPTSPSAVAAAARRFRSASRAEAARTSNACQICRDKKVKCSGQRPCKYCAKRGLECVFSAAEKRKLYSVSQIRELEGKVAYYERRRRGTSSAPDAAASSPVLQPISPTWQTPLGELNPDIDAVHNDMDVPQDGSGLVLDGTVATPSTGPGLDQPRTTRSQSTFSPALERVRTGAATVNTSTTSPVRSGRAIAPESALSSSETFSSEIKTLLVSRSNPGSAASPFAGAATPVPHIDRRGLEALAVGPWPAEEDAHAMLDVVILNVGISQQLFDVRVFSDNLSTLYLDSSSAAAAAAAADVRLPEIWIVEALLVFAVGRLLQGKDDESGDLPGTAYFREAVKRTPLLSELRRHGVMGVEVMALTALYLQITDRKDDAYLHSNTALRLAISHGMHRANSGQSLRRPENVHKNRLWWSVYMQERRLCAAGGYPMSIEDYAITTKPPYEVLGFPSATALGVNVEAARITGNITTTIYSQKDDAEATFINNVQGILHSLYEVEKTMPAEYSMEIKPSGLTVAGRPFMEAPTTTSRTSSSLYASVYSAVIHTVRPILLYMARNSRDPEREDPQSEVSPALVRLAEICVEAASKSLVILQELRKKEILAKNAFLDLDAAFSVGFVFVLVEAVSPGKGLGFKGVEGSRAILRYLVGLGNRAAASRLAELDQMCAHLSLSVRQPTGQTPQEEASSSFMDLLTQPFSFSSGYGNVEAGAGGVSRSVVAGGISNRESDVNGVATDGGCEAASQHDFGLSGADLASIPLEGENSLYWVYHTPGFSFTGVEQTDWEALENQIPWGSQQ